MAISLLQTTITATLLILLNLLSPHAKTLPSNPILYELTTLQSQSPSGIIHLSDTLLSRIVSLPTPRPFHFIIFFDAHQLHSKRDLALPTLKSEFSLISSSFYTNNPNQHFFFFDLEYEESQSSFSLFEVNSLPHIRIVPPSATDLKKESIPMKGPDYSGMADSMSEFIESVTGLSVGPIHRPPFISRQQILIIAAAILISIPFIVKKLISGDTILHDKNIWMGGAIFVYFFSVSGAMFNIIRKMPMFFVDRQDPSKLVFFYQGPGMQLGGEGFAIGFLYTIVGLLLAFVTHVLVRVRNKNMQRLLMIVVLFVSFWAVKMVVFLDNWKTGYSIRAYWPSSWQ